MTRFTTKVVPRDDLVEAEVQRLAHHKLVFNAWVVVVWLAIAALIMTFFALTQFDKSFLLDVCAAGTGQMCHLSSRPDAERHLFSIGPDFVGELDRHALSTRLREQFEEHGTTLGPHARLEVDQAGSDWTLIDDGTKYFVRSEDQTLNVYIERMPSGVINLGLIRIAWRGWAPFIIAGIPMTLFLSVASIALAVALALFGALGRLSKNPLLFGPATFYVSLFRGIPLLVQIFMWYLALPQIKIPGLAPDGIIIPSVPAGILALGVCYGAYMTETFRAGIQSISQGQTEAAMALGMSRWQVMQRIILPQALRVVIPPIGNDFITMTKDSSMVYVMSVWELLYRASKVGRQNFRNFETLMLAAAFYWIMTITLQFFQSKLEARMARGDR
ncbi:MAG: amino acid ABC transporter permease [Thermoflexales bacterium]|nr:amino acid ABC transporter permease [Thermoflexales bacterium]